MNENKSDNLLNVNDIELRFEQVAAIMKVNGIEVNERVRVFLQPYIDGNESFDQAVDRLQNLLAGVQ